MLWIGKLLDHLFLQKNNKYISYKKKYHLCLINRSVQRGSNGTIKGRTELNWKNDSVRLKQGAPNQNHFGPT